MLDYIHNLYRDRVDQTNQGNVLSDSSNVKKSGNALNLAMIVLSTFASEAITGCNNNGMENDPQKSELVERGLDYKLAEAYKRVDKYHKGDLAKQLKDAYQKISDMSPGEFNQLLGEYDIKKITEFYKSDRLKELFPEGIGNIEKVLLVGEKKTIQRAIEDLGNFNNF